MRSNSTPEKSAKRNEQLVRAHDSKLEYMIGNNRQHKLTPKLSFEDEEKTAQNRLKNVKAAYDKGDIELFHRLLADEQQLEGGKRQQQIAEIEMTIEAICDEVAGGHYQRAGELRELRELKSTQADKLAEQEEWRQRRRQQQQWEEEQQWEEKRPRQIEEIEASAEVNGDDVVNAVDAVKRRQPSADFEAAVRAVPFGLNQLSHALGVSGDAGEQHDLRTQSGELYECEGRCGFHGPYSMADQHKGVNAVASTDQRGRRRDQNKGGGREWLSN
jgi:hypothetical protein